MSTDEFIREKILDKLQAVKVLSETFIVNDVAALSRPAEFCVEKGIEHIADIFGMSDKLKLDKIRISDALYEEETSFIIFGVTIKQKRLVWENEQDV